MVGWKQGLVRERLESYWSPAHSIERRCAPLADKQLRSRTRPLDAAILLNGDPRPGEPEVEQEITPLLAVVERRITWCEVLRTLSHVRGRRFNPEQVLNVAAEDLEP